MPASPVRKTAYDFDRFESLLGERDCLKLHARAVEKPWGRSDISRLFGRTTEQRIGEIRFEHPAAGDLPLLVKHIFTSEKLSVQVHPNDEQARARGLRRGKSECWYILDAEPGATIGIGLRSAVSPAMLWAAALDGSIEHLLDWKPVVPGDFYYVPAGTIHALGAGLAVLELQQNADVTYRLYDYGRPRELHLNDGIAVSQPDCYAKHFSRPAGGPPDAILHNGPEFCVVRATASARIAPALADRTRWVVPVEGRIWSGDETASEGECLLLEAGAPLALSQSALVLIGAEGSI
jgi:mannose-6-phosphate isomerase